MNDLSRPVQVERPAKPAAVVADHAFVLHSIPWRETSAIAEVFAREHGRVGVVAKGAKRPRSATRSILQPFQPLAVEWLGRSEMKTLKGAEQTRILPQLKGQALMGAFYLNELLMKLTHREVPHEMLYDAYESAICVLADLSRVAGGVAEVSAVLRTFEVRLLRELGFALRLTEEVDTHAPILGERRYVYLMERGPVEASRVGQSLQESEPVELSGRTLINMADGDYRDAQTLVEAKALMRRIIHHLLDGRELFTRRLARELK
ncbi:MAG TPA: DNA repair protein RecO [Usitatibacteraceae bacterium]|nr:DNA repair protein RecO [Usitatibacteraceae bacterium]